MSAVCSLRFDQCCNKPRVNSFAWFSHQNNENWSVLMCCASEHPGPQLSRWTSKACGPFYTSPSLALLTGWLDDISSLPFFFLYPDIHSAALRAKLQSGKHTQNQTRRRRRTCESTLFHFQIRFLLPMGNGSSSVKLIKFQQLNQASWLSGFARLQTRLQTTATARAPACSTQQSPKHHILHEILANFDSYILKWVCLLRFQNNLRDQLLLNHWWCSSCSWLHFCKCSALS